MEVYHSNMLLNFEFGYKRRTYPEHTCYFWRKSILKEIEKKFELQMKLTRYRKFRNKTNVVLSFLFSNYAEEKKYGEPIYKGGAWFGYYHVDTLKSVDDIYKDLMKKKKKLKCYCINDAIGDKNKDEKEVVKKFNEMMEKLYPEKLPFEI